MKTWQIFSIGMLAATALFSLALYQHLIAGAAAVIVVGVAAYGFLLRPDKDVFIIRTTVPSFRLGRFTIEHDQIAVKVELTRLWLLFAPTFIAVAFLVATAVQGTTWRFDLFDDVRPVRFYIFRGLLFGVIGLLSAWISERWVLRNAEVCSLRSFTRKGRRVYYSFVDTTGGYYGGHGLLVRKVCAGELAGLVIYRTQNPACNKIPLTCLFHKFVIVGTGLTDLNVRTEASLSLEAARARMPS